MSETEPGGHLPADAGDGAGQEHQEPRVPRRVIGTPPPAQARTVLADPQANGEPVAAP